MKGDQRLTYVEYPPGRLREAAAAVRAHLDMRLLDVVVECPDETEQACHVGLDDSRADGGVQGLTSTLHLYLKGAHTEPTTQSLVADMGGVEVHLDDHGATIRAVRRVGSQSGCGHDGAYRQHLIKIRFMHRLPMRQGVWEFPELLTPATARDFTTMMRRLLGTRMFTLTSASSVPNSSPVGHELKLDVVRGRLVSGSRTFWASDGPTSCHLYIVGRWGDSADPQVRVLRMTDPARVEVGDSYVQVAGLWSINNQPLTLRFELLPR